MPDNDHVCECSVCVERYAMATHYPGVVTALGNIRDMPFSMMNDAESLRHTVKTIQHIAREAAEFGKL